MYLNGHFHQMNREFTSDPFRYDYAVLSKDNRQLPGSLPAHPPALPIV